LGDFASESGPQIQSKHPTTPHAISIPDSTVALVYWFEQGLIGIFAFDKVATDERAFPFYLFVAAFFVFFAAIVFLLL
jgi:hypothetical protein